MSNNDVQNVMNSRRSMTFIDEIITQNVPQTTKARDDDGRRNSRLMSMAVIDEEYEVNGTKRSSIHQKRSSTANKNRSRRKQGSRQSVNKVNRELSVNITAKTLPPNFHERVRELEHKIDHRNFNLDSVNELMLLYSQAVEFYNGMNDSKFMIYQDLIQKILVKPEVLMVMSTASQNPEAYAKE